MGNRYQADVTDLLQEGRACQGDREPGEGSWGHPGTSTFRSCFRNFFKTRFVSKKLI